MQLDFLGIYFQQLNYKAQERLYLWDVYIVIIKILSYSSNERFRITSTCIIFTIILQMWINFKSL